MEQINLSKYGKEIQKAYEQIVRGDGSATWVIYGPDSTKAYKVSETGDDFDEFLDSFNDAQIQFGWARVNPPGSDVQKNILIGWCPDSAPLKSRSSFAQNFAEVSQLLKGYHVQITARDADDLDKDELLSRLSAAAGARYSIQASRSNASATSTSSSSNPSPVSRPIAPKPVAPKTSSVPKPAPSPIPKPIKVEPKIIKPASTPAKNEDEDNEWNEPEVKERDFTKNPLKPNTSSWKPIGRVNLQDVIKEEKARPDPRLEIEQLKQKDRLKKDQEIDDYLKARPASFGAKAPTPVTSFAKDSNKVIGGISKSFGAENGKTPAQIWAEKRQKSVSPAPPASKEVEEESEQEEDEPKEEEQEEEVDVSNLKSKFDNIELQAEKEEEEEKVLPKPSSFGRPSYVQKHVEVEQQPEPESEEEFEQEQEQEPESEPESEPEQEPEQEEEEEEPVEEPKPLPSRGAVPPPPPRRAEPEPEPEEEEEEATPSAIAEYDYEAAEDNELTFTEGQLIINIEFIDEDWWLGETESGDKGLFPSNYVTLKE